MYPYYFLCILLGYFLLIGSVSATTPYRPSIAEVEAAAKPCLENNPPLDDRYSCPVGDFSDGTGRGLTKEMVECSIQIALSFDAIDKKGQEWAKQIQSSREKDMNKWIEDIRLKTQSGPDNFHDQYFQVCSITNWTIGESGKMGCAKTTDFFPETACKDIAQKKVAALQNMGYILASRGIAKSFQNDKDVYMDKQKSVYDGLIDKWSIYKRRVGNAVSKFNAYIKQAVK